jgi:hypothetical protein
MQSRASLRHGIGPRTYRALGGLSAPNTRFMGANRLIGTHTLELGFGSGTTCWRCLDRGNAPACGALARAAARPAAGSRRDRVVVDELDLVEQLRDVVDGAPRPRARSSRPRRAGERDDRSSRSSTVRRVASTPSSSGRLRSIRIRSGRPDRVYEPHAMPNSDSTFRRLLKVERSSQPGAATPSACSLSVCRGPAAPER